ncbi:MAG: Leucine, isoleucine, valine-, threonine-, and alanine-binding protein precursor [Pseudomonadota bacterium]|jgi:branched-chain amino acid transport system substrate-binding protein
MFSRLRNTSAILLSLLIVALPSGASADQPIAIGVSTILTGEGSTYGEDIKNVLLFANEKLGQGKFRLVIEDDKCNPKDAITVAKKLTSSDNVKGVVGYGCSGALLGAAPVLDRLGVPTIGTVVSSAKISGAGAYIFRTHPSDEVGVQVLMSRLRKEHRSFGVLSAQTDFCQGILDGLRKLPTGESLVIHSEDALPADPDFKPALLRLRSKKIDGLFLNAQDEGGAYRMLRQAKEIGLNVPFYTFYLGASAAFFSLAGADAEGVMTIDTPSLDDIATEEGKRLFSEFTARYGPMKSWTYSFATTFEGFRALSSALVQPRDPVEYLRATKFSGTFGPYSFNERGDIEGLSQVLKINREGRAVALR